MAAEGPSAGQNGETAAAAPPPPPPRPPQGELLTISPGAVGGTHAPREGLRVLAGPATEKQFNTVRPAIFPIACWRAEDMNFEFGSSFPLPDLGTGMAALKEVFDAHTEVEEGKSAKTPLVSLFGHADPVGDDENNKTLSGRRAHAVYALLIRDKDAWDKISYDASWGERPNQLMLETLGYEPGRDDGTIDQPTKDATKKFQQENGLSTSGSFDKPTRLKLYEKYMDAICKDGGGQPYKLTKEDFLGKGADSGGRADYQGCGEFNPVMLFSKHEKEIYDKPENRAERNNENAVNRRVVALLFRPTVKIDVSAWPCPRASEGTGACRKRFWSNEKDRVSNKDNRREYGKDGDTFGCRFYDRLSTGSPCEQGLDVAQGVLYVLLVSEAEVQIWRNRKIRIRGHGLDIKAETDDDGLFFRAPVPVGDYTLEVGDGKVQFPALPDSTNPYVLHIPHQVLPDQRGPGFFERPALIPPEGRT